MISLGGLVLSTLLNFGGNRIDESIIGYIKKTYNLVIGQKTAMELKENLANGIGANKDAVMDVVGRDLESGLPISMDLADIPKIIELTKNEMRILYFLLKNKGKIVSREDLMSYIWDSDEFVDDNTLTVNVTRVREKLEQIGAKDAIVTRRGQGYMVK